MVELFGKTFTGTELVGQLVSIVAMVITVFSFQCKNRSRILLFQIIGNSLFLLSYVFLQAWSAVAMNVIYLVRNTVYLYKHKCKWLDGIWTMLFFCGLCTVTGLFTWSSPRDILTLVGALFGCVALYMTSEKAMLAIKVGDSLCWLVYNALAFVTGGIICEVCNLVSIMVGIVRRRKTKNT